MDTKLANSYLGKCVRQSWAQEPHDRPSFEVLHKKLDDPFLNGFIKGESNPYVPRAWEQIRDVAMPPVFPDPTETYNDELIMGDDAMSLTGICGELYDNRTGKSVVAMMTKTTITMDAYRDWPRFFTEHLKCATMLKDKM